MDWRKADEYLADLEERAAADPHTRVLLKHVIWPLRARFRSEERTTALYDALFAVKL